MEEYEYKLKEFKKYRDENNYNYLLDVLIMRYELSLLKYNLYKNIMYKHILFEIDDIINLFIINNKKYLYRGEIKPPVL
jgi:hypothetical protein